MKFENEHQAKCHSSVEGAACKATPDTALRQVDDEHFKVRFRTFLKLAPNIKDRAAEHGKC